MGGSILVIQLLASNGAKLSGADAAGGAELLAAAAKVKAMVYVIVGMCWI
jgi:hypothetical protein